VVGEDDLPEQTDADATAEVELSDHTVAAG
jgi:hypothetical protein